MTLMNVSFTASYPHFPSWFQTLSCFLSSVFWTKCTPFLFSHLKMGIISHTNVNIKQDHKCIVLNFCSFFSSHKDTVLHYDGVQILIPKFFYERDSSLLSGTPRNASFTEPSKFSEIGTHIFSILTSFELFKNFCKPKETAIDLCLYFKFIVKGLEGQWSIIFHLLYLAKWTIVEV